MGGEAVSGEEPSSEFGGVPDELLEHDREVTSFVEDERRGLLEAIEGVTRFVPGAKVTIVGEDETGARTEQTFDFVSAEPIPKTDDPKTSDEDKIIPDKSKSDDGDDEPEAGTGDKPKPPRLPPPTGGGDGRGGSRVPRPPKPVAPATAAAEAEPEESYDDNQPGSPGSGQQREDDIREGRLAPELV